MALSGAQKTFSPGRYRDQESYLNTAGIGIASVTLWKIAGQEKWASPLFASYQCFQPYFIPSASVNSQ